MMRSHALLGFTCLLIACAGCSATVCDDALDKAKSCGLQDVELNDSGDACEDFAACQAECVNTGSCNDLRALAENPLATNDLADCMFKCGE
jgi:hypothetical protein